MSSRSSASKRKRQPRAAFSKCRNFSNCRGQSGSVAADLAMVIAMTRVDMMQMTVDQVVQVVAVRNRLVAASRPVDVTLIVFSTLVIGSALVLVALINTETVLVHMTFVHVVKMAVMEIIDMVAMLDCGMPASVAVLVLMVGMHGTAHWKLLILILLTVPRGRSGCLQIQ